MSEIQLASTITIANAPELLTEVLAAIDDSTSVVIDGSAVSRIDTAGLQVLCALQKELSAHAGKIQWNGVSSELANSTRLLGLCDFLQVGESE